MKTWAGEEGAADPPKPHPLPPPAARAYGCVAGAPAPLTPLMIDPRPTNAKAEMGPVALRGCLEALAQANPSEHPFTLALRLQVATGMQIAGAQAARLLEAGGRG